jgi:hypothetical protein
MISKDNHCNDNEAIEKKVGGFAEQRYCTTDQQNRKAQEDWSKDNSQLRGMVKRRIR